MRLAFLAAMTVIALALPGESAAQTYFSLCAGTPDEAIPQCQTFKAAEARLTVAVNAVPIPYRGYMAIESLVAASCSGFRGTGISATPPPECEAWKEAYAERARAIASVQALKAEAQATTIVALPSTPASPAVAAAPARPQGPGPVATPSAAPPQGPGPVATLPIIRVAAGEQVGLVGQSMQLSGFVGHDVAPPRLKINGQPATLFETREGDVPVAKISFAFRTPVPTEKPGIHIFVIEACETSGNCIGKEVIVRVVAKDMPAAKGKNYAFIVGNNDYKTLPKLKTAVADAGEVAKVLKTRYAFDESNVRLLINADRATILRELGQMRAKLTPDDRLLIYYAGHGQIDQTANEGFWQPVDAEANADYTWISNGDLRRYLRGMGARHVLVVADSCFSGSLTRAAADQTDIPKDRFFAEIDGKFSRKVITSGGTEPVADSGSGNHSIFAHYFLKALRENTAPYVTSFELFNKLVRAVTNNSNQKPEYGTIAQAGDEGAGDFTFILRN